MFLIRGTEIHAPGAKMRIYFVWLKQDVLTKSTDFKHVYILLLIDFCNARVFYKHIRQNETHSKCSLYFQQHFHVPKKIA